MEPLSTHEVERALASAVAIDVLTGRRQSLVRRGRCHFFERFRSGAFEVQLRLDWKHIGKSGFPLLKADFYDPVTGKMDKSMKGHLSHHTDSADDAPLSYVWEFQDDVRHLRVQYSWYISGEGTLTLSGSGQISAVNPRD